jgi:hypothetical protein
LSDGRSGFTLKQLEALRDRAEATLGELRRLKGTSLAARLEGLPESKSRLDRLFRDAQWYVNTYIPEAIRCTDQRTRSPRHSRNCFELEFTC